MSLNSNPCPLMETRTIDEYKLQNEQYWNIIEKQRLIIKTMERSLEHLTNENEILTKRNRELEPSLLIQTTPAIITNTTPTIPPKSPYRINNNRNMNHSLDTSTAGLPKRPPALTLAVSNHRAHFQNREIIDQTANTPKETRTKVQLERNHSQSSNSDSLYNIPIMSKSQSEPSTPAHPRTHRYDSLYNFQLENGVAPTTMLRNLSNINVKIIATSRHMNENDFTIAILQKEDDRELWRIEKSLSDLINLDSNLKSSHPVLASALKKLPDKSLFASQSPDKVDERRIMAQDYLQHAMAMKSTNHDILLLLCEFLSYGRIQNVPITLGNDVGTIKEGYLTKKGMHFGIWKKRYFILDHSGILKYYETKNGALLGNIHIATSQIASKSQHDSEHDAGLFRHAFLIVVEPKPSGASHNSRHIFCAAESDADRDEWIDALCLYKKQFLFFANDKSMAIDHSTENHESSVLNNKERPDVDYMLNYFEQTNLNRQESSTSKASSSHTLSVDPSSIDTLPTAHPAAVSEEQSEEYAKKVRHKSYHRKTFWTKKMSGPQAENPTSPRDVTFGTSDYEETCGPNQIFGIPLEAAVTVSRVCDHYNLPAIIHRCIEYLEARDGLTEQGIYRSSGSSAKVKVLKKRFNDFGDVLLLKDEELHDVHVITGLLKMWLRELPQNILTEALPGDFLNNIHLDTEEQRKMYKLGRFITTLPLENYTLLRSLCAHLIRVVANADKNKMTLKNISIVFSATLGIPSSIFNMLLKNFDYIFWTDRCEHQQQVTKDNTSNMYMKQDEQQQQQQPHYIINPLIKRVIDSCQDTFFDTERSRRNSIHYKDNTPKEFISLEKQLDAVVVNDSQLDDANYCSDGELEVAYFASRYNANSKKSSHLTNAATIVSVATNTIG